MSSMVDPKYCDPKYWRDRAAAMRVLSVETDSIEIKALLQKLAAELEARADQVNAVRDDRPKCTAFRLAALRQP